MKLEINRCSWSFRICSEQNKVTYPFFIFRLKKTWSLLSRRDKQTFDRLYDLFSEEANFEELRKHVDQLAFSPVKDCIPYLGIYLTDLTYIGKFQFILTVPNNSYRF
jgi:hypothetical protein